MLILTFPRKNRSLPLFIVKSPEIGRLRRSREEILFGILKSCAYERISVYQLMISQNLSYKVLKSCLDRLANSQLVSLDLEGRRRVVGTTRAGLDALKHYRNAISLLHR